MDIWNLICTRVGADDELQTKSSSEGLNLIALCSPKFFSRWNGENSRSDGLVISPTSQGLMVKTIDEVSMLKQTQFGAVNAEGAVLEIS